MRADLERFLHETCKDPGNCICECGTCVVEWRIAGRPDVSGIAVAWIDGEQAKFSRRSLRPSHIALENREGMDRPEDLLSED